MAAALCHDDNIQTVFVDGILWTTLGLAMEAAEYFGLVPEEARKIIGGAGRAVAGWREVAQGNRLDPV